MIHNPIKMTRVTYKVLGLILSISLTLPSQAWALRALSGLESVSTTETLLDALTTGLETVPEEDEKRWSEPLLLPADRRPEAPVWFLASEGAQILRSLFSVGTQGGILHFAVPSGLAIVKKIPMEWEFKIEENRIVSRPSRLEHFNYRAPDEGEGLYLFQPDGSVELYEFNPGRKHEGEPLLEKVKNSYRQGVLTDFMPAAGLEEHQVDAQTLAEGAEVSWAGIAVLGPSTFQVEGMRKAVEELRQQVVFQQRILLLPEQLPEDEDRQLNDLLDQYFNEHVTFLVYSAPGDVVASRFTEIAESGHYPVIPKSSQRDLEVLVLEILQNIGVVPTVATEENIREFLNQSAGLESAA